MGEQIALGLVHWSYFFEIHNFSDVNYESSIWIDAF